MNELNICKRMQKRSAEKKKKNAMAQSKPIGPAMEAYPITQWRSYKVIINQSFI
jgi:hypothetical protein